MQKAYIGIDASLISTAVHISIENQHHLLCFRKDFKETKWTKMLDFVNFENINYLEMPKSEKDFIKFTAKEKQKLQDYENITKLIAKKIKDLTTGCKLYIGLENYSYSSAGSSVLDIVAFGTNLRQQLASLNAKEYILMPPTQLKSNVAKLVYQPDKKGMYRNNQGIAGGSFKKHQICQAIIESNLEFHPEFKNFLTNNWAELSIIKTLGKPIDDVADCVCINQIMKTIYK